MPQHLTIAYITSRKEPHSNWFFESLLRETKGNLEGIAIIMVDRHAPVPRCEESFRYTDVCGITGSVDMVRLRVQPKPCVWQGKWRLTSKDYFAASNARNTALCHAPDGWIAYVDDLSVLLPGWLQSVREAMEGYYIVLGAYEKVKNLVVKNGLVESCDHIASGKDSRLSKYSQPKPATVDGGWMYGCSFAAPIESLLTINGFPEYCDGLGSEDYCTGICLENAGFRLMYDPRMMTYESEELHFVEPAMAKDDWHFENDKPVRGGNGRDDKSHAALNIAKGSKEFPNYCNFRVLRSRILAGEPFPLHLDPRHDWYTKMSLEEL